MSTARGRESRPRQARRSSSLGSTHTLPIYTKEPGESEVVIDRCVCIQLFLRDSVGWLSSGRISRFLLLGSCCCVLSEFGCLCIQYVSFEASPREPPRLVGLQDHTFSAKCDKFVVHLHWCKR